MMRQKHSFVDPVAATCRPSMPRMCGTAGQNAWNASSEPSGLAAEINGRAVRARICMGNLADAIKAVSSYLLEVGYTPNVMRISSYDGTSAQREGAWRAAGTFQNGFLGEYLGFEVEHDPNAGTARRLSVAEAHRASAKLGRHPCRHSRRGCVELDALPAHCHVTAAIRLPRRKQRRKNGANSDRRQRLVRARCRGRSGPAG